MRGCGELDCVSSFWTGAELSWIERLSISSFVGIGYRYKLYYLQEPPIGIPDGVEILSSSLIVPDEVLMEVARVRPALASDIFRYKLLSLEDTIWIDTDVISLGRPLPSSSFVWGFEGRPMINSAVLRYPKESVLSQLLVSETSKVHNWSKLAWGELGPKLLTKTIETAGLTSQTLPRSAFYEVTPFEAWKFFDPNFRDEVSTRTLDSYCIHVWNNVLRKSPLELKKFQPPEASFIWDLINQLDLDGIMQGIPEFPVSCNLDCWKAELKPPFFPKKVVKGLRRRLRRSGK
jgi:hypothetical protein